MFYINLCHEINWEIDGLHFIAAEATPLPADCAPPENEPAVIQQQPVADTPPKSEPAVIQQQPVAGGAQETLPYPPLASQTQPQPAGNPHYTLYINHWYSLCG